MLITLILGGTKDVLSAAVIQKRHANFILDTQPQSVPLINGFGYGIDFSPTVQTIGLGYYAFIVCIKQW